MKFPFSFIYGEMSKNLNILIIVCQIFVLFVFAKLECQEMKAEQNSKFGISFIAWKISLELRILEEYDH